MIVLDVESSGLIPEKHSILSLGAIDLADPMNQFYEECRVWDGAGIEDSALAINGFTKEEATSSEKQSEAELIISFIAWATDRPSERTLAAQNVSFDEGFVRAACIRAGIECPFAKRTIDVHTLAWLHMTERGIVPPVTHEHSALSSKVIQEYCGIPEELMPHNALTGARWHAEVISRMAYNKNLLEEFSSFPLPWLTS